MNITTNTEGDVAVTSARSALGGPAADCARAAEAGRWQPGWGRPIDDDAATRRVVGLLLDHRAASWVSIRRAVKMSDAMDAELVVVLSIQTRTASRHPALVASHVSSLLAGQPPRRGFTLEVVAEELADVGREILEDEEASLVVVDPRFGARSACRLADELGVPVLVARDAREDGAWVAASDMRHPRYPVLAAARDLSSVLGREVVYFHNARPVPVFVADPMGTGGAYVDVLARQEDAASAKRARLDRLAARGRRLRSAVSRAPNTAEAILSLARDNDADMVVVGHRSRGWLGRLIGRRTAEHVVDRSRRSVLVVPLPVTPPGSGA